MKLKKAVKKAEGRGMTHVAVDQKGVIRGYYTIGSIKPTETGWYLTSPYNVTRVIGRYTGGKPWERTKRKTCLAL